MGRDCVQIPVAERNPIDVFDFAKTLHFLFGESPFSTLRSLYWNWCVPVVAFVAFVGGLFEVAVVCFYVVVVDQ